MKIKAVAFSTKGIREHNEDSFLLNNIIGGTGLEDSIESIEIEDENCIFAVADGMGGHKAGDVASRFVVTSVKESFSKEETIDSDFVEEKLKELHKKLSEKGIADGTPNMGSTFVGLVYQEGNSGFFNVGDSRIYRFRNGFIQQLSHDDSLSEIIPDAPKNIIINAMGAGIPEIEVESRFSKSVAVSNDVFLICSDGVHGYISEDEMEEILSGNYSLVEKARQIVNKALDNNSDDNSTAVIVKLE